jgi:hypothetical protein
MTPHVKIRHRINQPSGIVAQLLDGDHLIAEHRLDQGDKHDQELLREATAATTAGEDKRAIRLLFPDHPQAPKRQDPVRLNGS